MFPKIRSHWLILAVLVTGLSNDGMAQDYPPPAIDFVSPDGGPLQEIPEMGAARVVRDVNGRYLLIDNRGMVIGVEREQGFNPPPQRSDPIPPPVRSDPPPARAPSPPAADVDRQPLSLPKPGQPPRVADPTPNPPAKKDVPSNEGVIAAPGTGDTANQRLSATQIAALQIYLDRSGVSPGVIDGKMGTNVSKALDAYRVKTGKSIDPESTEDVVNALQKSGGLPISRYTITQKDVEGPFISSVPVDYAEKSQLEALSYTSPLEALAERFHMDADYLRSINPQADFSRAGTIIKVADTGKEVSGTVARIVADKGKKHVFAYGEDDKLIAAYPATIGSTSTPSPSGTVSVERIAFDPEYTYNPKINFTQGDNKEILRIPPGPNGPVGSIWIALSKPTYGIHGTPEPAKIGKTSSNGCVRLTNWDADELARMVKPGVVVEFKE